MNCVKQVQPVVTPKNPFQSKQQATTQPPSGSAPGTWSSRNNSWGTTFFLAVQSLKNKTPLLKVIFKKPLMVKTTSCSVASPDKGVNRHTWYLWPDAVRSVPENRAPLAGLSGKCPVCALSWRRSVHHCFRNGLTLRSGKLSFVIKFPLSVLNHTVKTESHETTFCQH